MARITRAIIAGQLAGRGGPAKRGPETSARRSFLASLYQCIGGPFAGLAGRVKGLAGLCCHCAYSTAQFAGLSGFSCLALTLAGAGLACLFCLIIAGRPAGLNASPKRATSYPVHIMT